MTIDKRGEEEVTKGRVSEGQGSEVAAREEEEERHAVRQGLLFFDGWGRRRFGVE